jgi:hypothetical protein
MNRYGPGVRIVLFALVSACALFAQRDLATLVGTVTDSSGAVVADAQVTITETETGVVYSTTTNGAGEFVRPALKPSTYEISVSASGFKKAEQKGILLDAGARVAVNLALTVGDIGQTVEVTAVAPLLQTESTQVGAAIDDRTLTDTPLGGSRIFSFLARLSTAVVPGEPNSRDVAGGGFSANGVRSNGQNNFLLNGVDNNVNTIDFMNQTAYTVGPSVEAIGQMIIETNGYNAEYGRAAGGVVNVILKSGTNQLHGSLFEILQNRDLDANTWTNNLSGTPKGTFEQNQFGATAGGPIIKNRLFIFGDYQGTLTAASAGIDGLGFAGLTTIPTAAEKQGNFASILGAGATSTDSNGNPISFQKGMVYDPLSTVGTAAAPISRTPFPGNIIPASRMDPAMTKILQLFPATNQPILTGSQPTNDYAYNVPGNANVHQGDLRVDFRLSNKDTLFGSTSWSDTGKSQTSPLPGVLDNTGQTGVTEYDLARNGQMSYSRVWTPTVLTETRLSFSRLVTFRADAANATDEFQAFGIGGYDPTSTYANNGGLPKFAPSGYTSFGAGNWTPCLEYSNVLDLVQNVMINKGTHSLKMGFEYRTIRFPFFQVQDPHGQISYSTAETAFPSNQLSSLGPSVGSLTGDGLASALLGVVDNAAISTTHYIADYKVALAGYVQDDWRVAPKLTVNLGLRYELWSPIGAWDQSNFDFQNQTLYIPKNGSQNAALPPNFSTLFPNVTVNRGTVSNYLIPWDKKDFGPRIGLSYQVGNKTVIRAGYGIFYGGEENQGGMLNRGYNVPANETVSMARNNGISTFVGISDPLCNGCDYMPGGLPGGFPASPFTLNAKMSFNSIQNDFDNPLVHKWNVIVQRQLGWDTAIEVGYLGNHQAHSLGFGNPDTYANIGTTNSAITSSTQMEVGPACPPPTCQSVGSGLWLSASNGFGNYAAGSVKIEKRFSHGLQFLTSYTWSHALASNLTPLSWSNGWGIPDDTNWNSGYSSAPWDIRHSFTTMFNYELPFGKGKQYGAHMNSVANAIVGNWHTNGILTLRTGAPYTISGTSCQGVWSHCAPDAVSGYTAGQAPPGGRNPNEWFDINAYKVAAPLTGGNLGLNSNNGPPTRTLDFSIFKDFVLSERFRVQLRGEAFNLANTPVYSQPDNSLGDSKALGGNGKFGMITSSVTGTERHMQFALRMTF